jgi:hypothetical protein
VLPSAGGILDTPRGCRPPLREGGATPGSAAIIGVHTLQRDGAGRRFVRRRHVHAVGALAALGIDRGSRRDVGGIIAGATCGTGAAASGAAAADPMAFTQGDDVQ